MTEQTALTVPGWRVSVDHRSAFVRTFILTAEADVPVEYATVERYGTRTIDAVYPARIVSIHVRYQWDEEKQLWWSGV